MQPRAAADAIPVLSELALDVGPVAAGMRDPRFPAIPVGRPILVISSIGLRIWTAPVVILPELVFDGRTHILGGAMPGQATRDRAGRRTYRGANRTPNCTSDCSTRRAGSCGANAGTNRMGAGLVCD